MRISIMIKLIPMLILLGLVAWCTSNGQHMRQAAPVRAELLSLLQQGRFIDASTASSTVDPGTITSKLDTTDLNSLLYLAASENTSLEALKWIISKGANPAMASTGHDLTLLQAVAKHPQMDKLRYFLDVKLNPLERSADGRTMLDLAAQGGLDHQTLALLLEKGLKLSDTDGAGRLPIHWANTKSVSTLVAAGAQVDAPDSEGQTALMAAIKNNNDELAMELIRNSASVYAKDHRGRTPLHYAVLAQNPNTVIDALLAANAPLTARDDDGFTPKELVLRTIESHRYGGYQRANWIDKL